MPFTAWDGSPEFLKPVYGLTFEGRKRPEFSFTGFTTP